LDRLLELPRCGGVVPGLVGVEEVPELVTHTMCLTETADEEIPLLPVEEIDEELCLSFRADHQTVEQLCEALLLVPVRIALRNGVLTPTGQDLLEELGRVAGGAEVAVVQAPLGHHRPVQAWVNHGLGLIYNGDSQASVRDIRPVVREGGRLLGLDLAQRRLTASELARVVVLRGSPGGDARRQLRPDRARKRLERVAQPRDGSLLGESCECRQLAGGRPRLEEGGLGCIEPDDEYLGWHGFALEDRGLTPDAPRLT